MSIRFHQLAEDELNKAIYWYASRRLGLDYEFVRCVDETVARIVKNPRVFPVVLNDIRRAIVKRFPYAIYYEIRENELLVLAIFHSKRDPQQWRLRI